MENSSEIFYRLTASCGLFLVTVLCSFNKEIWAQGVCETNPISISSSCYVTPETYKVRIYEMGFCTSDPLSGTYKEGETVRTNNKIDESTCTPVLQSQSGSLVDISPGVVQSLEGKNIRPRAGTYHHAYIKLSNTFGLKGKQKINNTTYYSTSDGTATTNSENYSEWDETIIDFEKGPQCEPLADNRLMAVSDTFNKGVKGTLKAVLSHSSGGQYIGTSQSDCGNSTKIFGSFAPTKPMVISADTKGLQVTFTITDRGLSVIGEDTTVSRFSAGPFTPNFEVF